MARKLIYEDEYLRCTHVVTPEPDSSVLNACVCDSSLIYYNIQGEKRAVIERNTYSLHPGDLLIVSKLDAFYVHEDSSDCSEYMICTFSRYIFRHLDPEFSFMEKFDQAISGKANLLRPDKRQTLLFESAFQHIRLVKGTSKLRISYIGLLMMLINEISDSKIAGPLEENTEGRNILAYINENLTVDLSVKNLARQFYMSYSQFYRLFKKLTGMTLSNYITWKRVILARNLIQRNVKVKDALALCGFNDYTTFYKCNYKYLKVPPSYNHTTKDNDPLLQFGFYQISQKA